ncbi:MAG: hypothetical protein WB562_04565, partial [Candidatus Sulfotelmatobacter sp.]
MKSSTGKLMLALAASVAMVGCAAIGPPEPPSLELPKPPSDLHAKRKGNKITLTWTIPPRTTDRQSVRYLGKTRICRGVELTLATCGVPVSEVAPPPDFATAKDTTGKKMAASYVGSLPSGLQLDPMQSNPFATVTYAVEVLNLDGRGAGLSNQVHVSLVETLPPPADFAAHLTGQGVVLSWTGELSSATNLQAVHSKYQVFRRQEGSRQTLLGEVEAGGVRELSLTDQSLEWEKTYYYHADTLTLIKQPGKPDVSIEGDDTPEVKIFAHDVFPPAVPAGLQAVFSGPGQQAFIDLIWFPVTDSDLAGYNVYRHAEGEAPM